MIYQRILNSRYVLAVRSQDFKNMFAMQAPPASEPLKIHLDATNGAVGALVKYLYTDAVDPDVITEDLIALASKYNLTQLKVSRNFSILKYSKIISCSRH